MTSNETRLMTAVVWFAVLVLLVSMLAPVIK
jgi:hypothetical protein